MEIVTSTLTHRKSLKPPGNVRLTGREKEILLLLMQGFNQGEIGKMLYIAENTVKTHTLRVRDRTGTSTAAEMITYCLVFRLIEMETVRHLMLGRLSTQARTAGEEFEVAA